MMPPLVFDGVEIIARQSAFVPKGQVFVARNDPRLSLVPSLHRGGFLILVNGEPITEDLIVFAIAKWFDAERVHELRQAVAEWLPSLSGGAEHAPPLTNPRRQ